MGYSLPCPSKQLAMLNTKTPAAPAYELLLFFNVFVVSFCKSRKNALETDLILAKA
jgi:hypothetical protein